MTTPSRMRLPRWQDRYLNPKRCWLFGHRWRFIAAASVEGCRRCAALRGDAEPMLAYLRRELDDLYGKNSQQPGMTS